jgi:hypothetical protein
MTGSPELTLGQRAQYVANDIAIGIVSINPDPSKPAVRLVLRDFSGSDGRPETQVTARPGDVLDWVTRRLTLTSVVSANAADARHDADGRPVGYITFHDDPIPETAQ